MATATSETIVLEGFGPPSKPLRIPVPAEGGLIVLHGINDAGKSEALKAIDSMLGGPSKPSVTRGAMRGHAEGFGVTLKVAGGRSKKSGELLVESLEGRFMLDDLIDPKIKDPLAADKKRVEVLLQLTGAEPTAEIFYSLLGTAEQFEAVVGQEAIKSADIVAMAGAVKRDIEEAARRAEDCRDNFDTRAISARQAAEGVNVEQECDQDSLSATLEQAIRHESRLKSQQEESTRAEQAKRLAKLELAEAEKNYQGPSVEAAIQNEESASELLATANARVEEIKKQLLAAEHALELRHREHQDAIRSRMLAEQHEKLVGEWRKQVATNVPPGPTERELEAAALEVALARQGVEQGAIIRRAQEKLAEADKLAEQSAIYAKKATKLRDAAAGVAEILNSLVQACGTPLRVEDGRLLIDRESLHGYGLNKGRSGPVYYAELSHGTRSLLAADIAIKALGPGGACVLRQEFYEGMAPKIKSAFAARVADKGVKFYTAEATDDEEIVAEVM